MKTFILNGKNSRHFAALILSGLAMTACGPDAGSDGAGGIGELPQVGQIPTGTCTSGQYQLGALCVNATNFDQACQLAGGRKFNSGGKTLCQVEYSALSFYNGSFSYPFQGAQFPVLLEDQSFSSAWSTGVPVKTGDRLVWNASGGWGKASTSGRLFSFTTVNCTDVSLKGVDDGQTKMNVDLPKGLIGTEGTHTFLLGTNVTHTFAADGTLSFGFNIPEASADTSRYCSSVSISRATIRHCEDSSHQTYPCP